MLVNASTRYRCGKGTDFACAGKALDDRKKFKITTKVVKKSKKGKKGKGKKGKGKGRR